MKYRILPSATHFWNWASVGALSLPVKPPMAITALPVASSIPAACCEPMVAAAHFVFVLLTSLPRAVLPEAPPPAPPAPPPPPPLVGRLPVDEPPGKPVDEPPPGKPPVGAPAGGGPLGRPPLW